MAEERPPTESAPPTTASPPRTASPSSTSRQAARRGPGASADSLLMRIVATAGIIGIGAAIGAVVSEGYIAGLIVAIITLALTAVVWGPRRL